MDNLMFPPLPIAEEWREKYLQNWEELLNASSEILETQKRIIEASRVLLAQLKERK